MRCERKALVVWFVDGTRVAPALLECIRVACRATDVDESRVVLLMLHLKNENALDVQPTSPALGSFDLSLVDGAIVNGYYLDKVCWLLRKDREFRLCFYYAYICVVYRQAEQNFPFVLSTMRRWIAL